MDTPTVEIVVCRDAADLAARAAERFAELADEAAAEYCSLSVALAGGSTPKALYDLLAAPPYHGRINWPLVHCFFGDERLVPPTDKDSNYGMAHATLLSRVPIPEANIHRLPTEDADADAAARAAEEDLRAHFNPAPGALPRFDLVLLGLGDDGHTASLFPGQPAVEEETRLVVPTPPGRLPPPVDRLTLTLPVINAAAHVIFLVAGAGKAAAVRQVLAPEPDGALLPAARVQPSNGTLTWLLDDAAATELRQ
ncbi:MAG TPA: 6-phosphogluconolactonase [Chloroflexia bacterium]|nr:6-phosphogluconolactonase [Chloroflexia bacterium]